MLGGGLDMLGDGLGAIGNFGTKGIFGAADLAKKGFDKSKASVTGTPI